MHCLVNQLCLRLVAGLFKSVEDFVQILTVMAVMLYHVVEQSKTFLGAVLLLPVVAVALVGVVMSVLMGVLVRVFMGVVVNLSVLMDVVMSVLVSVLVGVVVNLAFLMGVIVSVVIAHIKISFTVYFLWFWWEYLYCYNNRCKGDCQESFPIR